MTETAYLLDTHIWIWWHTSPEKLSEKVQAILAGKNSKGELFLADISLWEFGRMVAEERLILSIAPEKWLERALDMPRLRVTSLSPEIALTANSSLFADLDDLVAQVVAATARQNGATVLTKKTCLLKHKHIKTLWEQ